MWNTIAAVSGARSPTIRNLIAEQDAYVHSAANPGRRKYDVEWETPNRQIRRCNDGVTSWN